MPSNAIFIVEDDAVVAEDLRDILRALGYKVPGIASSGPEAVEESGKVKPDLVLMDILLEGEMDGIQAAEEIRKTLSIPVIYLTAYADREKLERAKATRPFGFIVKPFDTRELQGAIETALCRHKAEEALKESERFSASLLENAPNPIMVINPDTSIRYVNSSLEALTGYSSGELIGTHAPYPWFTGESDNKLLKQYLEKAGRGIERAFKNRREERFWVSMNCSPVKHGGEVKYYLSSWVDITERKLLEMRLSSERNMLRAIISALGQGICIVNRDYGIEWQNDHLSMRFGHREGEKCFSALLGLDLPCDLCNMRHAIDHGKAAGFETVARDGRCYEVTLSRFTDIDGSAKALALFKDVAGKPRLNREAERAGRLALVGEMASGTAHEINNPINGIINYAQLLIDEHGKEHEDFEIFKRIVKEGERIADTVKALKDFASEREDEFETVDVCNIVSESLSLLRPRIQKNDIELKMDFPPNLPPVPAIKSNIREAFLNIIRNALDALEGYPEKRLLEITGGLRYLEGRKFVRTVFHDTGPGIPAHAMERIYEPFFSTKKREKGSGLGLAITNNIVKDHGGRILFESIEKGYTRVTVDLPGADGTGPVKGNKRYS